MQQIITSPLFLSWYDIYGKMISNQVINFEAGIQRIEIISPKQQGFYFLLLDIDGVPVVKKLCVME